MTIGWVYLIFDPAKASILKLGYTNKDPKFRAQELSGSHSPFKFKALYGALVEDPRRVEQKAHRILSDVRVGKEWFKIDFDRGVDTIRKSTASVLYEFTDNDYEKNLRNIQRSRKTSITVGVPCAKYGCGKIASYISGIHLVCADHRRVQLSRSGAGRWE